MTARQILDRDFLEVRARLLDIAASLDRIDRGEASAEARAEAKHRQLQDGLHLLTDGQGNRAERLQMLFSLPYDPGWRSAS